jgi:hypothetical protein
MQLHIAVIDGIFLVLKNISELLYLIPILSFSNYLPNFSYIDRHYQHSNRSGSGYPKANAIA